MGLLDKIISEGAKAVKDAVSEENKEKASEFLGSLKGKLEEQAGDFKKAVDDFKAEVEKETGVPFSGLSSGSSGDSTGSSYIPEDYDPYDDPKTCREKILEVIADEFPKYEVRENVSPAEIGGTGKFMNYSIVVYDGAAPKLFIMIIGKTTTTHREYRWSRQEAEKRGYTFLNFVEHYPNTPEYIKDRLHKYL